jgi:hypothetical protein
LKTRELCFTWTKTHIMTEAQKRFVELTTIDGHSFAKAEEIMKIDDTEISRKQFTTWDQSEDTKNYRAEIRKIGSYYNSKKNTKADENNLCEFSTFREFYDWYQKQPEKCHYCETPASTLQKLFDKQKPILKTKRLRGYSLEIERIDSKSNIYSKTNCVLACYFCNNHKSDIISADDFKKYFAPSIREYLADKLAIGKTV